MTEGRDSKVSSIDGSFARYELQTALLDGLFVSSKKSKDLDLRLRRIVKTYSTTDNKGNKYDNAVTIEIKAPCSLSVQAESVLLAVLKLTGLQSTAIPSEGAFSGDDIHDDARGRVLGRVVTSERTLLTEAGLSRGGSGYSQLRRYLREMSEVRIHYENKLSKWTGSSWLLEYHANDDGRVVVHINWRLAGAIFGEYLCARIDLNERRRLKSSPAKTLHRWLSAHLWAGRSTNISYGKLQRHIWSGPPNKMQLSRLKAKLLPMISALPNWEVVIGVRGVEISHFASSKSIELRKGTFSSEAKKDVKTKRMRRNGYAGGLRIAFSDVQKERTDFCNEHASVQLQNTTDQLQKHVGSVTYPCLPIATKSLQ